MPLKTSSLQLFGLDLRQVWQDFCQSWQEFGRSRYLAWLSPAIAVRLLRSDGTLAWWDGRHFSSDGKDAKAEFEAIEVAEDLILRRQLRMPPMLESACAQAVELEVHSTSPFPRDDVVWAWHAKEGTASEVRVVEVVFASRKQVLQYVGEWKHKLSSQALAEPEVWVLASDAAPIVLGGWGEGRRAAAVKRHRCAAYVLLILAFLIGTAMALTPSWQLRSRSLEAIAAFDEVQRAAAGANTQREVLSQAVDRLEVVRGVLAEHADMLRLMTALTNALQDDTYLQGVQTQGLKVTVHGLTADAAALMQKLGAVPGFKDVRAPQAATRAPGATAENFRIELQLDPAVFGLTAGERTATVSGAGPAIEGEAGAPLDSNRAIAAKTTQPASAPGNAAPRPKSRFTSGGS